MPNNFDATEGLLDLTPDEASVPSNLAAAGARVELLTDSLASTSTETASLLHVRLRAVTILLLIVYGMVILWKIVNPASPEQGSRFDLRYYDFLRPAFLVAILASLSYKRTYGQELLRGIEYTLFGVMTLLWVFSGYRGILIDVDSGNVANLLLNGRTAMIGLFILMIVHGIFLPHRWQETTQVVLTMALAPVLMLVVFESRHPEFADKVVDLMSWQYVSTDILILIVGVLLASYASHILNNLRRDVRDAKQYGQYRLVKKLGSGGMGDVFLAEHVLMKRPCALKLIRPEASADRTALLRFEREVKATSSLTHPHTIEIYDYGHTEDGTFYYVMEYLPGLSLYEMLKDHGPMSPGRVIYLMRQACSALAEAHAAGLIHRDLKPANLYVSERGGLCDFVKVLDFGLVKLMHQSEGEQLTAEFTISGTPLYMSPEQALGNQGLDARCDLYAIGAIAYHLLTGKPPFSGDNAMALMVAHAHQDAAPLTDLCSDIPDDLQSVILRCLAKSPDDRYADAIELERAFAACADANEWDAQQAAIWWHDLCQEPSAVC